MIENPAKDSKLRASWGASVADAINRHEAALGVKNAKASNLRGTVAEPFPWMVVGGTEDGDAQFVIYLPSGCLVKASTTLTPTGVTALQDAEDRYTINSAALGTIGTSAAAATTLYVVVHTSTGTNASTSAMITTNLSSVPSGNTVDLALPIAKIFRSTVDAVEYGCVAQQLVRSSVVVSGTTASSTPSAEDFKYVFRLARHNNKISVFMRQKHLMVDGTYIDAVNGYSENTYHDIITTDEETLVYLNVMKETNGYTASFARTPAQGAKWSIAIGRVERQNYSGSYPVYNFVVGALILNSMSTVDDTNTTDVDVVTDVAYSESTHKLTKTKRKLTVIADAAASSYSPDVFQATDHANEHNS